MELFKSNRDMSFAVWLLSNEPQPAKNLVFSMRSSVDVDAEISCVIMHLDRYIV